MKSRPGSIPLSPNLSFAGSPAGTNPAVWQALAAMGQALVQLAQAAGADPAPSQPALSLASLAPVTGPLPSGVSVVELINEFLLTKARAGRSDRYLRALRNSLLKFSHGRAHLAAAAVCAADLQRWLDRSRWAARTRKGYLADVATLYAWGVRRGLVKENPARGVEIPTAAPSKVALHSPAQVAKVLEFARARDMGVCRVLALRYFAGVRTAEAGRLSEADLRPGFVEIPAAKSKTRARRLVTIHPALASWLALGGELAPLGPMRLREVTAACGVPWPHNVTRHSFCTYHLAAFGSAARTALEAGHSEAQLFAHYRERCTPDDAAAFWAIRPL